jgi:hypothetical protein
VCALVLNKTSVASIDNTKKKKKKILQKWISLSTPGDSLIEFINPSRSKVASLVPILKPSIYQYLAEDFFNTNQGEKKGWTRNTMSQEVI